MNILIPTADYPPIEGGIATVTLQLSRELAALGHAVVVVAPYFPDMDAFDKAEPARILRYRGYGLGWLRFVPMFAKTFPHLRQADLVLGINIAYGGIIGLFASRFFRTPYITFGYAYEFLKFKHTPVAGVLRRAYRSSKMTVAISTFTRDQLTSFGVPHDRIEIILPGAPSPNGLDPDALDRVKRDLVLNSGPTILSVGRMIPRKGHTTLVRALPKIIERHPEAVLVCVGRGRTLVDVARIANELGVRSHVRLPGHVPDADLAALYASCDVFALPTDSAAKGQVEGFGLVFSEAHAHGKPVVAGRSGGVVDAVIDGETGILVEPGNPDETADAILSLLDDPSLAQSMGERGRRRVDEELNWRHFTQRLLERYEARS